MRLKIFVPACALIVFVAFRSFQAGRNLDKLESFFSTAGLADFSPEAIKNASPKTLGQMLEIASNGSSRDREVLAVAQSMARKRHAGSEWARQFVQGYNDKQRDAASAR
jgi:hypothetical protein